MLFGNLMSKPLMIACGALALLLAAALVALKVLIGEISDLSAEKATIQLKLDSANMDLAASARNSERMLAEKDAQIASERRLNQATLQVNTLVAGTRKDIANATEGTECIESDPFAVALDGMRKLESYGLPAQPIDRVPPASRAGKSSKPGHADGAAKGVRRPGTR